MRLLLTLLALGLVLKRPHGGHHGDDGDGVTPRPKDGDADGRPTRYKDIDAGGSVSSAQDAVQARAERGRPRDLDGDGTPDVGGPEVKGPAGKIPVGSISKRHFLEKIGLKSRSNHENTVVLPGTDTDADLAAIRDGRATWHPDTNRYEVNGRFYGMETSGTVFPDHGPGLVRMNKGSYEILMQMMGNDGDLDTAYQRTYRNPRIYSQDNWGAALAVFRNSRRYRGDGS